MINEGGVYMFVRDGKPVYIGQTSNLNKRLRVHHFGFGADVYIIKCGKGRLKLEKQLIDFYKPEFNNGSGLDLSACNVLDFNGRLVILKPKNKSRMTRSCSVCNRGIRVDNVTGVCGKCQHDQRKI